MRKILKKLASLVVALTMVIGVAAPAFAASSTATTTDTVTIHKVLLTDDALGNHDVYKEGYDGNKITDIKGFFDDNTAEEIEGVYFKIQKLKDSIEPENADENNDAQWEDLAAEDGKTFDGKTEKIDDTSAGLVLTTTGLNGVFRIVEDLTKSDYKGTNGELLARSKAVPTKITLPLVNDNGIVPDAHVYPKNTQDKPEIDKNFEQDIVEGEGENAKKKNSLQTVDDENTNKDAGADYDNYDIDKATASAMLGQKVPYEVKTKIPKDSKYKKLLWVDQVEKGLTYEENLEVIATYEVTTGEEPNVQTETKTITFSENEYIKIETERGFRFSIIGNGLTKVEEAAKNSDVEFVLKYSAHLNKDAELNTPKKNTITFNYSNKPGYEKEPESTTPVDNKIDFKKTWAEGSNEVTEADKDIEVLFILQKKENGEWVDKETKEGTFEQEFEGSFENLDADGEYRVVELVSGYEPEYVKQTENGKVEIVNKIEPGKPDTMKPTEPKVQFGGKKFVKTNAKDGDELERLENAVFYIKNEAGTKYLIAKSDKATQEETKAFQDARAALESAVKTYNDLSAEEQKSEAGIQAKAAIATAQNAYNTAFEKVSTKYDWGDKKDALTFVTNDKGQFEIKGLDYGNYQLEEAVPPSGYATNTQGFTFTVAIDDTEVDINYTPVESSDDTATNDAKRLKNNKVTIPQTGGIGTMIFTIVGIALMVGAYIAMKKNKEVA